MLQNIVLDSLKTQPYAGSDLSPYYTPPIFPPSEETEKRLNVTNEDGMRIYNGSCHCGAVMYSVLTKPLEEQEVMCCNCSSCSRVRPFPPFSKLSCTLSGFSLFVLSYFCPIARSTTQPVQDG